MQETMTQMSNQITDKWNALSKKSRIRLGVGIVCCIVAIGLITLLMTRPNMQRLYYQSLDAKDIAEVVRVLDESKIKYEVIDNGTNVEIDAKDYNTAKLALAQQNIPKGNYTFADAMDNTMSTTESEKQAKMHRLAEVQLAELLTSMEDIAHAEVKLVVPENKNSFIDSKLQSSASIVVDLHAPQSSQEAEGLARLVASSVENLKMENITIMDTKGNTLFSESQDSGFSTNKQQELKLSAEKEIQAKVTKLLEPIYDEVRVSPNLILDFNHYEELREEYVGQEDTGKGLVNKESIHTQSSIGGVQGAEPGVTNNGGDIPIYQVGGNTNTENKTTQKETEYQNNKIVSNTIKNQGNVDYKNSSLSVHVFKTKLYKEAVLEGTLPENLSWESFKETKNQTTPIQLEEGIIESIQNGTGIDSVVVYAYEKPIFVDKEVYEIQLKDYLSLVIVLIILLIIGLLLIKLKKQNNEVDTEPELEIEEMLNVARQDLELEEIEFKENLETKKQIEKFVDEKPEAVANLLRNWLTDEEWE